MKVVRNRLVCENEIMQMCKVIDKKLNVKDRSGQSCLFEIVDTPLMDECVKKLMVSTDKEDYKQVNERIYKFVKKKLKPLKDEDDLKC